MAELGLTFPPAAGEDGAPGPPGAPGVGVADITKKVLVRTGGCVERDTPIDIIIPGAGWTTAGEEVTFANASEFTSTAQVFLNGILMFTGENAATDNDVYFVAASGQIAFETNIDRNDMIQVWKFGATASG